MTDFNNGRDRATNIDARTNEELVRNRDRRHGLGWVPWLALVLLILLGLFVWWMMKESNENDSDDSTTTTAAMVTTTTASANTQTSGSAGSARTAGGIDLLELASKGSLASVVGQQATVNNLEVMSVVADEGFWVGSAGNQFFVHLSAATRNNGESAPRVTTGSHVNASGQMMKAPASASSLGVTTAEGAKQLTDQGAYLEASSYNLK